MLYLVALLLSCSLRVSVVAIGLGHGDLVGVIDIGCYRWGLVDVGVVGLGTSLRVAINGHLVPL